MKVVEIELLAECTNLEYTYNLKSRMQVALRSQFL